MKARAREAKDQLGNETKGGGEERKLLKEGIGASTWAKRLYGVGGVYEMFLSDNAK